MTSRMPLTGTSGLGGGAWVGDHPGLPGSWTRFDLSSLSRATRDHPHAQRLDTISGIAVPSAPSSPAIVTCVFLAVLKPATEMVTLKSPGL